MTVACQNNKTFLEDMQNTKTHQNLPLKTNKQKSKQAHLATYLWIIEIIDTTYRLPFCFIRNLYGTIYQKNSAQKCYYTPKGSFHSI